MGTKMILDPAKAKQISMFAAAAVAVSAVLALFFRVVAALLFGWYFGGFTVIFDILMMLAAGALLFVAYMDKVPAFVAFIPVALLGIETLFTGNVFIGLLCTAGAVVAILGNLGVLKLSALDNQVVEGVEGAAMISALALLAAAALNAMKMLITMIRLGGYGMFFRIFFAFIFLSIFLLAVAVAAFFTRAKEAAAVIPQPAAPACEESAAAAPVCEESAPAAPAAAQNTQFACDPAMFKASLQLDGYCGLVKHILLLLFTFGIWYYVWIYRVSEFLNHNDSEQKGAGVQLLLCMFIPFYIIYWYYKSAQRLDRFAAANGVYSNLESAIIICVLFAGFAAPILMQEKINCVLYGIQINNIRAYRTAAQASCEE